MARALGAAAGRAAGSSEHASSTITSPGWRGITAAARPEVAWDSGNGATGEVVPALRALPGRHVLLNETIDGTFPAHHPDPTVPENLVQLQQAVARERCDLGIGFDGDGDRIGVVDAQGRILWGDQLLMVLARDVCAATRARRSSPTSRRARCCSTRSPASAASR